MPDWNKLYLEKNIEEVVAAEVLTINQHLLSGSGLVLDFASGLSGNGLWLEKLGYKVNAWDSSEVAVNKINQFSKSNNLNITSQRIDLEESLPRINVLYDVIIVSYYLHRESLPYLYDSLKKNGLLFYQTFSGERINGIGPSNKNFRLRHGELLTVFSNMQLLYYREDNGLSLHDNSKSGQVYFVAKK